jgi:hypothetical protein
MSLNLKKCKKLLSIDDNKKIFQDNLIEAKLGIIVYLFIQTIMYQINTREHKFRNTLLNTNDTLLKLLGSASIAGCIGALTIGIITLSRNTSNKIQLIITVFGILALYDILLETSGSNTWLASENIKNGVGLYAELNDTVINKDNEDLTKLYVTHDIFEQTIVYSTICMIAVFLLYLIYNMLYASHTNFKTEKFNIYNIKYWWRIPAPIGFLLESIILMGNAGIPIVQAIIKKEPINSTVYFNSALYGIVSLSLHIMCQYAGLYGESEGGASKGKSNNDSTNNSSD